VLAAADLFGRRANPLPAAVALECLHTYSLVHDDLPCMDNDDLRRGRPTAHRQFDEATALLAGDALLTFAFQLIARHYPADFAHALTRELAEAAGSGHLIGGQMEDLLAEKKHGATAAELEFIHRNKTAAMIAAALAAGGQCGGADDGQLALLRDAGRHLGLAFQIVDDILDATADTATLGKTAGKDARAGKATSVSVLGLDAARRRAQQETDATLAAFARLPDGAPFLTKLAGEMLTRKN
jgi:geranylgeranyl pyrophosphate synthase